MSDALEQAGPLTLYDYGYLKGDYVMYPKWGAALATVSEWCNNRGYGEFGKPTKLGRKAMKQYEQAKAD